MKSLIQSIPFLLLFITPYAFSSESFNDHVSAQVTYTDTNGDNELTGFTHVDITGKDKSILTESTKQQLQALTQQCMLTSIDVLLDKDKDKNNASENLIKYEKTVTTCIRTYRPTALSDESYIQNVKFIITHINYPRVYKDQLNQQALRRLTIQAQKVIAEQKREMQDEFDLETMEIKFNNIEKSLDLIKELNMNEEKLKCLRKNLHLLNDFEQIIAPKKNQSNNPTNTTDSTAKTQPDPNPSDENSAAKSSVVPYLPLKELRKKSPGAVPDLRPNALKNE
jgi:hypothetical protein